MKEMGLQAAVQALKKAERLKEKVINCEDLLNDNEAWVCQQQLQEIYQQVLIMDLEYALDKKVEQELWNHGFKNFIASLQSLAKDKKNPKRVESQALLSSCLDVASGFYLTLLQEVCTAFDLDLPFRRKDVTHRVFNRNAQTTKPLKTSCYYICQHCLVHLGDIARYRNHSRQAEAFYSHAVKLSPTSGQPYNQLALLETTRGDRLSTVFHYVRSIAVRHMFPAAITNLDLVLEKCSTFQWNKDSSATKVTMTEYVSLYLKLHAYLHTCQELESCASYVKTLTDTLTPHVATQSFNAWKLVQMFTINAFSFYVPCRDGEKSNELTKDELKVRSLIVDLIAGSLNAFLLPVYTLKQDETFLDYFALPVVKLTLDWVRLNPQVLSEEGFSRRLQIWPSLCRLLNVLQSFLTSFPADSYSKVPLPEDCDLQGFIPLEQAFTDLNFSLQEDTTVLNKLRGARLLHLGNWIVQHTPHLTTTKMNNGHMLYEAGNGPQTLPSSELIRELEELSMNKVSSPSPPSSETASSRASNVTPDLAPLGQNPSVDILSMLDGVQEKRAGILKPQAMTSENGVGIKKKGRQNVAMQSILRRSQEQETKQVTFKTPSPSSTPSPKPSVLTPPIPPANWRTNNISLPVQQLTQVPPPPPAFPFPPPTIDNRGFANLPPPPARPINTNYWHEDLPHQPNPSWWQLPEESRFKNIPQPPRPQAYPLNQTQVQPPANNMFNNILNFKNPFSQPPPFPPPHVDSNKPQVLDSPMNSTNMLSPTYSLFNPTWTTPQFAPPPVTSLMGPQSLWNGPGPSPLERLLEQQKLQKQQREGLSSHTDTT